MAKTSYSNALARLQVILDKMETNEPDIDELAKLVKEASTLIKQCKKTLRDTESEIDTAINSLDEPLE
jgi:exodeoxyribonuclease VII small subunit